ncbi:NACHT, LRR and PYD domains-containing protein 1b allele 2 [Lamellibrachia satsuma]|nr:NACHT, LRR and PYD domains-containing protein 1b allele 2 [Lamellibrachia satsuma]
MATSVVKVNFSGADYKNWLKVGVALQLTTKAMTPFCEDVIGSFHTSLKTSIGSSVCSAGCTNVDIKKKKKKFTCRSNVCDKWLAAIEAQQATRQYSVDNTTVALWPVHPWQIAQYYMGPGQGATNTSPSQTDPGGILQLAVNCQKFHPLINTTKVKEVRDVRNAVMHSPDFQFVDADMKKHLQCMIDLLQEPTLQTQYTAAANDAITKINQIVKADIDINDAAVLEQERNIWKSMIANQTTNHMVKTSFHSSPVALTREIEKIIEANGDLKKRIGEVYTRLGSEINDLKRKQQETDQEVEQVSTKLQKVEDEVGAYEVRIVALEAAKGPPEIENIGDRLKEVLQEQYSDMRLSIEESAPLDQVYVELRLQQYEDENLPETLNERDVVLMEERMQRSPVVKLPELFDKLKDGIAPKKVVPVAPKKVLIRGKAGVGKTTLVRRIASQWAAGELWEDVFSHVFVITLRELSQDKNWTLKELLLGGLPLSTDEKDAAFRFICRNASRILFLADGLDEIHNFVYSQSHCRPDHDAPIDLSSLLSSIIGNSMLPGASMVVTSRPTLQVPMKPFEHTVEVYGFPRDSINTYVSQFCANEEVKHFIMKTFKDNQSLLTLCYIPLHCRFVCQALADMYAQDTNSDVPAITTTTQLYVNATTNSAKRLHPRLKGTDADEDDVLQVIKGPFMKYADLAKQCVKKVPLRIIFYTKDLTDVGLLQDSADDMQCGVMTQSRTMGKSVRTSHKRCWSFNHLTLQEYFSAIGLLQGSDDDIWQLLQDESSIRRHEVVISFILGLCADKQNEDYIHQLLSSKLTLNPRELVTKLAAVLAHDPLKAVTILHESQDPNLVDVIAAEVKSKEVFPTEMRALTWLLKQAKCPVTTLK